MVPLSAGFLVFGHVSSIQQAPKRAFRRCVGQVGSDGGRWLPTKIIQPPVGTGYGVWPILMILPPGFCPVILPESS